ncbi:MAG: DEAD/DEAH box helicase [Faecalibacillus sp.]
MDKFKKLGLSEHVLKAIKQLEFEKPSPIQEKAIPVLLEHNDIIGQAQTGTGKTLAFAGVLLSQICQKKEKPQAYILSPTRELSMQIFNELKKLGKYTDLRFVCVYGGSSIERQIKDIKKGVDIVVGTPGRIMDLMRRHILKFDEIDYVVLDEADEMLNMGFIEDIETILKETNDEHQTMLFSATMPEGIKKIAQNYMKDNYQHIQIQQKTKTAVTVKQYYVEVKSKDRFEALCRLIDSQTMTSGIIFCRTKKSVDEVTEMMQKGNYNVEAIHGDLNQDHRSRTLRKFKDGTIKFLIATDVAARGIDVEDVSHVINYELPQESDLYIHRIGRTGRANKEGIALTIVCGKEEKYLKQIAHDTHSSIEKIDVPTLTQIQQHKIDELMIELEDMIYSGKHKRFKTLVQQVEPTMLKDITAALFELTLNQKIGYSYTKEKLEITQKKEKRAEEGFTRLFLTVGTMDKIKKNQVIDFITRHTDITKDDIQGIDIKRKFTFVNIRNQYVKKVIKKCSSQKLNNRKVEIEIAHTR